MELSINTRLGTYSVTPGAVSANLQPAAPEGDQAPQGRPAVRPQAVVDAYTASAGMATTTALTGPALYAAVASVIKNMPGAPEKPQGATPQTGEVPPQQSPEETTPKDAATVVQTRTPGVVFEFDQITKESIVKFMDLKGNVVVQLPPAEYLKIRQLMGNHHDVKGELLDQRV